MMKSCLQARTRILGSQHPDTTSSATALSQWEADLADLDADDRSNGYLAVL